eukprot:1149495-Pelagomonas_calceolata.AAC.6
MLLTRARTFVPVQPLALVVSAFCTPEAGQDACSSKLLEKLARRVERAAATLSEQQCEWGNGWAGKEGRKGGCQHCARMLALMKAASFACCFSSSSSQNGSYLSEFPKFKMQALNAAVCYTLWMKHLAASSEPSQGCTRIQKQAWIA